MVKAEIIEFGADHRHRVWPKWRLGVFVGLLLVASFGGGAMCHRLLAGPQSGIALVEQARLLQGLDHEIERLRAQGAVNSKGGDLSADLLTNAYKGDRNAIRTLLAYNNASALGTEQRSTCASLAELYNEGILKLRSTPGGAKALKDLGLPRSIDDC